MKRLLIAAASSLALAGLPAMAADMAVKAAPKAPATAYTWTGCYFGGEFGVGWSRARETFSNGAPTDDSKPRGGTVGGVLGCNYQMSNIVVGVEGDYEATDINGEFFNATGATSSGSSKLKSDGSIRARLGVTPWDRTLLYVTGGWAFARYSLMGGPDAPAPGLPCCGFNTSPDGWTVGGGLEYAIDPNWTARAEYRHSDFGTSTGALNPTFPLVNISVRNSIDAFRFALTYKFTSLMH